MFVYLAIILILATFFTKLATRLGVPGLIAFMAIGMLLGSDGLNLIYFDDPVLAQQIAIGALIIILFEGGFNTQRKLLRLAWWPSFSLATIGIIITAVTLGLLTHFLLGLSLEFSLLIGAIVASTDAAAIFSLFRNKSVEERTAATLEIESASNDPMAIILTVSLIAFIQSTFGSPFIFVASLLWQIGAGIAVGYAFGKIGPLLMNRLKLETGSFYSVLIVGIIFASYGFAELIGTNGFIAVFLAGLLLGHAEFPFKQGIDYFLEGLSTFAHVLLFVMLGLLVFPLQALHFWQHGLVIAALLMFVARPVAVFLSTVLWRYSFRERIFLSWAGLKGAVPIVLATYPLVAGLDNADYIFNTVFFVVLISALVQGSTIDFVAGKLHLLTGLKKRLSHSMELISFEKSKVELLEYEICDHDFHLIGKKIRDISLPKDCLITAIVRKKDVVPPRGSTQLKAHDTLFILIRYEDKEELLNLLACPEESLI